MQQELFEAEHEQQVQQALHALADGVTSQDRCPDVRGILPFVFTAEDDAGGVTGRAGLPLVVHSRSAAFRVPGAGSLKILPMSCF